VPRSLQRGINKLRRLCSFGGRNLARSAEARAELCPADPPGRSALVRGHHLAREAGVDAILVAMAPPDEATAEQDRLEGIERGTAQEWIARPRVLRGIAR